MLGTSALCPPFAKLSASLEQGIPHSPCGTTAHSREAARQSGAVPPTRPHPQRGASGPGLSQLGGFGWVGGRSPAAVAAAPPTRRQRGASGPGRARLGSFGWAGGRGPPR
ncbi:hypothetical protein CP982_33925 [Streptomyces spectabilis]|uniref:Uncharacterized protein n=1 Tax=Streptomyces spectabilis TaxID=68270 RepID=A0A5P2XDX6_STRST|nr:hypothetical protein CP982_33925 [Streptomyces spectabilis]